MIWRDFLARQSRRPRGLFGRLLMGSYLDRANADINALVYRRLAPAPQQRLLEIGFGGAELLLRIAADLDGGRIDGVEISPEMIAAARRRARGLGLEKTTGFHQGSVESLPFAASSFDAVCSVHTIYFWPDLPCGLAEIARVIRPGGRLVLGFSTADDLRREGWAERGFEVYAEQEIIAACKQQGFEYSGLDAIERRPRGSSHVYYGIRR